MKILFINQFFWPDSSANSQQLTDLAGGLPAQGHQVSAPCGEGGYAAAGSSAAPADDTIFRVNALPFSKGKFGRILSFYATALLCSLTAPRQDAGISLTIPALISLLGSAIELIRGSRYLIWQGIYPNVAIDLNC